MAVAPGEILKRPMPRVGMEKAPSTVVEATKGFYRCPMGHQLPNNTSNGQCTPVWCASEMAAGVSMQPAERSRGGPNVGQVAKGRYLTSEINTATRRARDAAMNRDADAEIRALIPKTARRFEVAAMKKTAMVQKADEVVRIGHAVGRYAARRAFLKYPNGMTGAAVDEFVQERLDELSVDAVAEWEYQLKTGDDRQRMEAADKVMTAKGYGKGATPIGASPVIILTGSAAAVPPWRSTVDAEVVK